MAVLYIDSTDLSGPMHGSGGYSVTASAIRCMGAKFSYVGCTSAPLKIGEWTEIRVFGKDIKFLPVIRAVELDRTKIGFKNINFALAVLTHMKAIKKLKPAAVFTHSHVVFWLLSFLPDKWDICFYSLGLTDPLSLGKRNFLERFFMRRLLTYIQARAFKKADIIFAAADNSAIRRYRKELNKFGVDRDIISLPSGVNTAIFIPKDKKCMRNIKNIDISKKIFVFIGRLSQLKGVDFLMEALNEFNHRFGNGILLILGEGEYRKELQNLCNKMGLNAEVKFLGNLPPAEVADFIGASDACVIGSLVEGFSFASVEALACGKPIVSTKVDGVIDIIKNGVNGFIVEERNPVIFAEKMNQALFLKDAENYSRKLALENYSEEMLWKKLEEMWPVFK